MGTRSAFNLSSFTSAHIRNRERSSTSQKNNEPRFHCSTTSVFLAPLSQGVSEGSFCLSKGCRVDLRKHNIDVPAVEESGLVRHTRGDCDSRE